MEWSLFQSLSVHWYEWQSTYNVNHQVSVASALIIYGKVRDCSYFHEHRELNIQLKNILLKSESCTESWISLHFSIVCHLPRAREDNCWYTRRELLLELSNVLVRVDDDDVLLFLGTYMGFERRFFYMLKWLNVMQWKLILRLLSIRNGLNWISYKKVIFDKTEAHWSNTRLQIIKLS